MCTTNFRSMLVAIVNTIQPGRIARNALLATLTDLGQLEMTQMQMNAKV